MAVVWDDMLSAAIYTILGGFLGLICLTMSVYIVPKIMNALTPQIDEEKEILKGNNAVAEYFGRVVQATIIGISLIIAAAVLAGIHGW